LRKGALSPGEEELGNPKAGAGERVVQHWLGLGQRGLAEASNEFLEEPPNAHGLAEMLVRGLKREKDTLSKIDQLYFCEKSLSQSCQKRGESETERSQSCHCSQKRKGGSLEVLLKVKEDDQGREQRARNVQLRY